MNSENTDYREEVIDLGNPYDVKMVRKFLTELDFEFIPQTVDYTIILYNLNDEILGTGSSSGNVLKYVAVTPKYRETTAFAKIITHLLCRLIQKHQTIFAFTKPRNIKVFEGLGFKRIATAEPLFTVLEYGLKGISDYVANLKKYKIEKKKENIAAIVINANPFTLGHLCLIELAASENDHVYLFVVQENLSVFPFEVRWELIRKGVAHIENLTLIPGGDYIVSGKTFPNYFLKGANKSEIIEKQAELDIIIFRDYIVPALEINHRYVGKEVYCVTTEAYNIAMKKLLPPVGVEVKEIERRKVYCRDEYISASKIREAVRNDELPQYFPCIPDSTREYLLSDESAHIREIIKKSKGSRHA